MNEMKPRFDISQLSKSACAHLNPHLFAQEKPKKAKYGNKKVEVDGVTFDSQKEAKRWGELKLLLKAGEIGMLQRQVVYELKVNDKRVCKYVADFVYLDSKTGETVVEDVKSSYTRKLPVFRLKKKLMKELLNIEIKEV